MSTKTEVKQPRVRVVLPFHGMYLMEVLVNPKFKEDYGKKRFPGGGVEDGETPEKAAVRELYEELGAEAREEDLVKLCVLPHPRWGHDEHYFYWANHNLTAGYYAPKVAVGDPVVKLTPSLPSPVTYMGNMAIVEVLAAYEMAAT